MRAAFVALAVLLSGCGAYLRSFHAQPGGWGYVAYRSGMSTRGINVSVAVVESDSMAAGWCRSDCAGIACEFGDQYLRSAVLLAGDGGWRGLTFASAWPLCAQAMRWAPEGGRAEADVCAWALVEMRFREMRPAGPGE